MQWNSPSYCIHRWEYNPYNPSPPPARPLSRMLCFKNQKSSLTKKKRGKEKRKKNPTSPEAFKSNRIKSSQKLIHSINRMKSVPSSQIKSEQKKKKYQKKKRDITFNAPIKLPNAMRPLFPPPPSLFPFLLPR